MPYIPPLSRVPIDAALEQLPPLTAGGLAYLITRAIHRHLKVAGWNFAAFATVVGVVVCCVLELYRRTIAPYETEKLRENGDVK